jgi:membrane protein
MMPSFSQTLSLLKTSFASWKEDRASIWCASLAYYTVFSLGPLLLFVVSIVGIFLNQSSVQNGIVNQVSGVIGPSGKEVLQSLLSNTKHSSNGILGSIIGFGLLILGASGIFTQLQQMFNHIWGITPKDNAGTRAMIFSRMISFSMLGVVAFLLLVSLLASTVISSLTTYMSNLIPLSGFLIEGINFLISFILTSFLFACIFKFIPDIKMKWVDVWFSAIITSLLFTIGKTAIGVYIGHSGVATTYGAAGSLVLILLWVYYSSLIVFFGVELNKAYLLQQNHSITPRDFAERKSAEQVEVDPQYAVLTAVIFSFTNAFFHSLLYPKKAKISGS